MFIRLATAADFVDDSNSTVVRVETDCNSLSDFVYFVQMGPETAYTWAS